MDAAAACSLHYPERESAPPAMFHVYVIRSGGRRYVGKTNDLARRLRQHNGEISGGARATRGRGPWEYELVVDGFECDSHALQAEWRVKRERRRLKGRGGGGGGGGCPCEWLRAAGDASFARGRGWTSNSPPPAEQLLCVRTDLRLSPPASWPVYWGWEPLTPEAVPDESYVEASSQTAEEAAAD